MNRGRLHLWAFIGIMLSAFSTTGCASFAGHQLPEKSLAGLTGRGIAVDYDTDWSTLGQPNANASNSLSSSVRSLLQESGMFSGVTYGKGIAPYHLHFSMKNEGSRGLAFISGYISGLTLALIPAHARDDYILSVDVSKDGKTVKGYEYKDHISSWIQLFLVFAMAGHNSQEVELGVRSNMIRNFLHDLDRDLSSGEMPVARSGPIVVSQLTRRSAPL